jgi:hypothetical protein
MQRNIHHQKHEESPRQAKNPGSSVAFCGLNLTVGGDRTGTYELTAIKAVTSARLEAML